MGHVLVMVAVMVVLIEGINRQFLGQESEFPWYVSVHMNLVVLPVRLSPRSALENFF